jgi:hypothetical protein
MSSKRPIEVPSPSAYEKFRHLAVVAAKHEEFHGAIRTPNGRVHRAGATAAPEVDRTPLRRLRCNALFDGASSEAFNLHHRRASRDHRLYARVAQERSTPEDIHTLVELDHRSAECTVRVQCRLDFLGPIPSYIPS